MRLVPLLLLPTILAAQQHEGPRHYVAKPTQAAITPNDLRSRLYPFSDDSMMGRLAGTPWNDKGTDYIASEVKRFGLQPGGENGTYFQSALLKRSLDAQASVEVDGRRFAQWTDFAPRDQGRGARAFDGATAIYGGSLGDTLNMIPRGAENGKVVVLTLAKDSAGAPVWNVVRNAITARFIGAAAIAVTQVDYAPAGYIEQVYKPVQTVVKGSGGNRVVPSYFYVSDALASAMLGASAATLAPGAQGKVVHGSTQFVEATAPGRNVIAILRGSDPKLRGEYVAIGAHNDHIGFGGSPADHDSVKAYMQVVQPQGADSPSDVTPTADQVARVRALTDSLHSVHGGARLDSIYNGADDDGSGSVTVLEIAEAFAKQKVAPKRSMLFVWHVGEEEGMLGSGYFTDNPTVPRDSIVAQLNIDMVGRGAKTDIAGERKDGSLISGGPGYLQLIGARRLSTELGDMAESTNKAGKFGLNFDYALDADGHPQNIYCRSDHYSYARYGIPIIFFTTGGHADYHQVTDEPQYIDYDHMADIGRFIYTLGARVANLDHRVVVDKQKPADPHGSCRQ